jgi:hypothetical protein
MGLNTFFTFENYHFLVCDHLSLRRNESILLEYQYISTSVHDGISQRIVFFVVTAMRILGLIFKLPFVDIHFRESSG